MRKSITFLSNTTLIVACILLLASCAKKKSDLIAKDWKASELDLGGNKLSGDDVGGLYLTLKADSSFTIVEQAKMLDGKWKLNEEGTKLSLSFKEENRVAEYTVKELTAEKLILEGDEFGMHRIVTYVVKK